MLLSYRHSTEGPPGSAAVIPSVISFNNTEDAGFTAYSGVKFDADGDVYRRQRFGAWGRVGTWLFSGTNSAFHIHRTVSSGSLTTDGNDDQILSTDRIYDIQNTTPSSTASVTVTFRISNVADSVTYSTRAYTFNAIVESP